MRNLAKDSAYWREFDKNEVTHSAAHYLMAIDRLRAEFGYARATDVAQRLDVSRGAASIAMAQLKKRKWVKEDAHRFLLLTAKGERVVKRIEVNSLILTKFFVEVLGVSPATAKADACKTEHLLSLETGRRLLWLMRLMLGDDTRASGIREAIATLNEQGDSGEFPMEDDLTGEDWLMEEGGAP